MATWVENRGDDKAPVDLSAPQGWKKTVLPKKSGTPRRNAIVFISPTGEEIKSKRQLDLYLKSHPGGPSISEFDWSTGETPRRSRRLSEKSKETESPESERPSKRQNKSSSEKVEDDADGEDEVVDDVKEDTKTSENVERKEVDDPSDLKKGEGSIENAVTAVSGDKEDTNTDTNPKTDEKEVKGDDKSVERTEDQGTDNKTTGGQDEQVAYNKSAESAGNKEEAEKQKEPEAPSELENEKADEKPISISQEKISSASLSTQELDGSKEGTEKHAADAEIRASNDNIKEAEDGSRPVTNYSIHHEEKRPHEPKASQVSC